MKERYVTVPIPIFLLTSTIPSLLMGAEFVHLPFQRVPTIVMSHDYSETAQSLIQVISDNRTFDVIACTGEEDDLKEAFYYNKALAGVVIPEHFPEGLLDDRKVKIMVFSNGTIPTAASGMRGTIAEALGTVKNDYMLKLTGGKGMSSQVTISLITPIRYVTKATSNPPKNVAYMMMEGIFLTIVQIGAGCMGAYVCERASFGSLMEKAGFTTDIVCVPALGCMATQTLCFGFPYRSPPWAGILITVFTCFGVTLSGILQNLSTRGNCEEAMQKRSIISFTMLLVGCMFPVIPMPRLCKLPTWFMPNIHYIMPLRNMTLVERSSLSETHHALRLMGFCVVVALLVAKKFKDARTGTGSPLMDDPLTESGVISI